MLSNYYNLKVVQALDPILAQTTRTSDTVDRLGYEDVFVVFNIGFCLDALSGSRTWTPKLQESDDGSSFTDVADADTDNGAASYLIASSASDERSYLISYKGTKRYVRMVVTHTGTHTNGSPMGITVLLGNPTDAPVTQD